MTDPSSSPRGRRVAGRLLALIAVLHRLAESGWTRSAVTAYAMANGAVVPGPTDALLIPLAAADPPRAFELAWWSTVGATIGGLIAYAIGALAFEQMGRPLLAWLGVGVAELDSLRALFARRGWLVVVLGSLPLLSPKAVSIAAGAFGLPVAEFAPALFAVRLARFMAEATVLRYAGAGILRWVERKLGRPLLGGRGTPRL